MSTQLLCLLSTREVLIKEARLARLYGLSTRSSEQHFSPNSVVLRHPHLAASCVGNMLMLPLYSISKLVFDPGPVLHAHIQEKIGYFMSKTFPTRNSVFVLVMSCMSPMWQGVTRVEKRQLYSILRSIRRFDLLSVILVVQVDKLCNSR